MRKIFLSVALLAFVMASMPVDASVVLLARPIKIDLPNGGYIEIIDDDRPGSSDGIVDSVTIHFPDGKEKWVICAPGGSNITSSTHRFFTKRPIEVDNPNDPWFTQAMLFRIVDDVPKEMWKPSKGLFWACQELVNARFARIKLRADLQRLQRGY